MKHRGKSLTPLLSGILIGCALSGPAVHAAAEAISACRSSHAVFVDGNGIELEAYEGGEMQGSAYRQSQPQLTELAKELMIPGSTK